MLAGRRLVWGCKRRKGRGGGFGSYTGLGGVGESSGKVLEVVSGGKKKEAFAFSLSPVGCDRVFEGWKGEKAKV